jgi:hypothetical protein
MNKYIETKIRGNMPIGPLLVSSSLRLAVRGSAMVRRQRKKSCGKRREITRHTRPVTQTLVDLPIAMACMPVRYIPCRSNMKSAVAARNQERPGIVPGLKDKEN